MSEKANMALQRIKRSAESELQKLSQDEYITVCEELGDEVEERAKQKIISAQAEAKSMTIRARALTQNKALVEYEAVQKWDGKMPHMMMGGGTPFINIKASK